jgi:hypothetical protein
MRTRMTAPPMSAAKPTAYWRRRLGFALSALALFAVGFWGTGYALGVVPWLGYAAMSERWQSAGVAVPSGSTSAGTRFGFDTFLFFKGQEVFVDYTADIRAGSMLLGVYNPLDGNLEDGVWAHVTESGAGVWRVPIKQTGLYKISIAPSVVKGPGRGYDVSYRLAWGARRAP